jgi:hypothetical protein
LIVSFHSIIHPLELCGELGSMAGNNILESFSLEILADDNGTGDFIGSMFQSVEQILVKPGWSALRQVSFNVTIPSWRDDLSEVLPLLQSLPDKYLSHFPKLESVAFSYECNVDENYER